MLALELFCCVVGALLFPVLLLLALNLIHGMNYDIEKKTYTYTQAI